MKRYWAERILMFALGAWVSSQILWDGHAPRENVSWIIVFIINMGLVLALIWFLASLFKEDKKEDKQ